MPSLSMRCIISGEFDWSFLFLAWLFFDYVPTMYTRYCNPHVIRRAVLALKFVCQSREIQYTNMQVHIPSK